MPGLDAAHEPQPTPPPPAGDQVPAGDVAVHKTGDAPAHRIRGAVIAGVIPRQPPVVIRQAAELAYSLGVELVLAYVDVTRFQVAGSDGVSGASAPIDPDGVDDGYDPEGVGTTLRAHIATELASYDLPWSFVQLAGEPARALGHLAAKVKASVIVVGTRERGLGARLEEILTGAVSVHLAHRQNCPVLVVPLGTHSTTAGDADA